MANSKRTFTADNFTLNAEGLYEAGITNDEHGFGSHCHMSRALLRDDNGDWNDTITPYKILENGDFKMYVEEPGIYRVTLTQD